MAAPGLVGAVAGCCDRVDGLPAFDSLGATCHAVDEVVDRSGEAPEPAVKFPGSGKDTGKSAMCTSTVEVLWFDNDEACEDVYELLADARDAWYTVEQQDRPPPFVLAVQIAQKHRPQVTNGSRYS